MTKNYDSDFCGSLPLNFINLIQPYGILLVLQHSNLNIIQVSENIQDLFSQPSSEFLNKNLSRFIDADSLATIQERVQKWAGKSISEKIPFNFVFSANDHSRHFMGLIHFRADYLLMEMEEIPAAQPFSFIYQEVKYIMAALKVAKTTEELVASAALEIKRLSGFDKVMIYQFDKEWNGYVIAEEKEPDMDAYFGLYFPASDIPRQARELYFRNPYRFIPDQSYVPVRLNPVLNPISFTFTDLSDCNIRSVAPVHLEYLGNMKVRASMSTPIIKDEKLWGLIACHHKTPRYLNYEMRSAFELLSNFISTQLSSKEKEREFLLESRLKEIQSLLYKSMLSSPDLIQGLIAKTPYLLDLLDISGAAVVHNDQIRTIGKSPEQGFIRDIIYWLKVNNIDKVYMTESMPTGLDPEGTYKDIVAGFIAIPISATKGDYILGFRPEVIQTVSWGGNPNAAINFEKDNKTYHPRNSFTIWKETVKQTSISWHPLTIIAAGELKYTILELMIRASN